MMKNLWAFFFILQIAGVHSAAQSVSSVLQPKVIARQAFKSSVFIQINDKYGKPMALGSGFVIAPSVIATNLHVIQGGASARINLVGSKASFVSSTALALDTVNDLALIEVAGLLAPSLELSDAIPEVGERVFAVGNPKGLEGTLSDGLVSALRNFGTRKLIQITAPISPGSSGGPVLNDSGKVIGVSVGTLEDGQNLNFAIPSQILASLLKGPGSPISFSSLKAKQEKGRSKLVPPIEGLELVHFQWRDSDPFLRPTNPDQSWDLHFVLRNQTNSLIEHVQIIILLLDRQGAPVATYEGTPLRYNDSISPHTAKTASVSFSAYERSLFKSMRYRVLKFEVK